MLHTSFMIDITFEMHNFDALNYIGFGYRQCHAKIRGDKKQWFLNRNWLRRNSQYSYLIEEHSSEEQRRKYEWNMIWILFYGDISYDDFFLLWHCPAHSTVDTYAEK